MKKINKKKLKVSHKHVFTSKANVLKILAKKTKKSRIEKIYDFTISDWKNNEKNILKIIAKNFGSTKIIVRSSAKGEDSFEQSKAGQYLSILNVNSNSENELKLAINSVIKSYYKNDNRDPKNQILIQTQTPNIIISGVVFTRTENVGAPYYVINYEEGSSTDGVTKGKVSTTVKIFRNIPQKRIPKKWIALIKSIKEIESTFNTSLLDIEFGISKTNQVTIFQVRPITSVKNIFSDQIDLDVKNMILSCKKKFLKLNKPSSVIGNKTVFSDMVDWNPAEIIGNRPNPLDYSLYDNLIMKKTWHEARTKIGYQNVNPYSLMVKFGNKPYVDVRGSFNSLIPKNIPLNFKKKLIKYYLEKLVKNPYLHDKVEFEILFTCYDLSLDSRLKELIDYDFTKKEIQQIKEHLLIFTNEIIKNFTEISIETKNSLDKMTRRRTELETKINENRYDFGNLLLIAEKLLIDCRKFGTLQFSTMARIAFIGSILLKSIVKEGYLSSQQLDHFMNSIKTPLSELQEDYLAFIEQKISKNNFLKKYGHLRPGTYDISAMRYDKENPFFENIKFLKSKFHGSKVLNQSEISKILSKNGLKFNKIDFLTFVKESLAQREVLKFEFTRNLSDALELIAKAGSMLGFSRDEIKFLDYTTIFNSYKKFNTNKLKTFWRKKIFEEKKNKLTYDHLVLPSLLFSEHDFELIKYYFVQPNYVTNKSITAELVHLVDDKKIPEIENKIIVLENADPGYDWIFTKNPAALITKYGGVASHMSIRCAEVGLPAAIGCGEIMYEKLLLSSKVLLDCENKQVVILEHEKSDEIIEVRKTLKSMGYIK